MLPIASARLTAASARLCHAATPCRRRTVARTGILTPDVAAQDAAADSIRDSVKERLATRSSRQRRTRGGSGLSPPATAQRTRELTRLMRGEQAVTPGFGRALRSAGAGANSPSAQRRRRRRGKSRPTSVPSVVSNRSTGSRRSRGSRGSRASHGRRRARSPASVASGASAFSGGRSVYSSLSRARAIDVETRMLLRSLSETNEAMTRALTRA